MGVDAQNIGQAAPLNDGDNSFPTVGPVGYLPLPDAGNSGGVGIDGANQCVGFTNESNPLTANTKYTTWIPLGSPVDLSPVDSCLFYYFRNTAVPPTFNSISADADAFEFIGFSGGVTTEWGIWRFSGGVGIQDGSFQVMRVNGAPLSQTGSFDASNITSCAFVVKSNNSPSSFGYQMGFDQMVYINGPVELINDITPGAVSPSDWVAYFSATGGELVHNLEVTKAAFTLEFGFPIDFLADELVTGGAALGIGFKPSNGRGWGVAPSGYYQLRHTPGAGATQTLINPTYSTESTAFPITLDSSAAGASLTITTFLAAGITDVSILGDVTINSGTLTSPSTVSLSDGLMNGLTIDDCAAPVAIDADLAAGSSLTITAPQAESIQFNIDGGDYSDIAVRIPTSTVILGPTTATPYDLTGIVSPGVATFDNLVGTTANVVTTINSALFATAVVASPTAGSGTITLDEPPQIAGVQALNLGTGRVWFYNNTTAATIEEVAITTGYSRTWTNGVEATVGDSLTMFYLAETKKDLRIDFTATADSTLSFENTPEDDDVWAYFVSVKGVTGVGITEFSVALPSPNVVIDAALNTDEWSMMRVYLWIKYAREVAPGAIQVFWGGLEAISTSKIILNTDLVDGYLDTSLVIDLRYDRTEGVGFTRTDGAYPALSPTAGGGCITVNEQDIQVATVNPLTFVFNLPLDGQVGGGLTGDIQQIIDGEVTSGGN